MEEETKEKIIEKILANNTEWLLGPHKVQIDIRDGIFRIAAALELLSKKQS